MSSSEECNVKDTIFGMIATAFDLKHFYVKKQAENSDF